jgi:glycosyltransferase involved in cell wall biosynthesis
MNGPLISVIMNCYNSDEYLKEAIDSVLAQTNQNWEIIFWDNQSTDDSAKIFNSYCDPRFHYFYAPMHTTLGEARNLAVEESQGGWIAFLDCDDLWFPEILEKQVAIIQEEEKNNNKEKRPLGIVYCRKAILKNGEVSYRQFGYYQNRLLPEGNIITELLLIENFIPLSSSVVTKKGYQLMGGVPIDFKQAEDYYLFVGVASQYKARAIQDIYSLYRIHDNNNSHQQKIIAYEEQLRMFEKWEQYTTASKGEKIIRIKELNTRGAFMMVKYEKRFFQGLVRILKHGSVFLGIKLMVKYPFKGKGHNEDTSDQ